MAANVADSYAKVRVDASGTSYEEAGGLAGAIVGTVSQSVSTGSVTAGDSGIAGGLAGEYFGDSVTAIENSYATGSVTGSSYAKIGGLIGAQHKSRSSEELVETSYATGVVSGGTSSEVGGFVGQSTSESLYGDDYWDTTTSGTSQAVGKGKSKGIIGLTTEQLQSGLPTGFDPAIWGEKSNINNGLPYLLANPPPK